jgi:hypothetical protein
VGNLHRDLNTSKDFREELDRFLEDRGVSWPSTILIDVLCDAIICAHLLDLLTCPFFLLSEFYFSAPSKRREDLLQSK